MDWHGLIGLVLATAVIGMVPGPIVGALVGRALYGGLTSTFGFLGGVFVGDLVWLMAAVSGLGFVAAMYSTAFLVVKYVGALYLIYLGVQALRSIFKKPEELQISTPKPRRKGMGFVSGLLVTLGNPKLVAFYVGFLPTFIDVQAMSFDEIVMAAILVPTTFLLFNFAWAFSAAKAKHVFRSATPLRILNGVSGGLLIGAGAFMMADD
jgi:threonine/homoserine/homoserine lactone efflux protein